MNWKFDWKTRWWLIALPVAFGLAAVLALVLGPDGAGGPEAVVWGRDSCARCRMHLSEPGFAAQTRDAEGTVAKYDDIGCLLEALREAGSTPPHAWVEDHDDKSWVPLAEATLVRSKVKTPMISGIVAFRDTARARAFASEQQGKVVSLAELLEHGAPVVLDAKPGEQRPLTAADAAKGKAIYVRECSSCHGEYGRGDGPAARFVDPPPRDFTKALFKLRTTGNMAPPATADVLRVVERGIPGTAMPSFAFLSADERKQITAYVLDRAGLLEEKEPEVIADPGAAPAASETVLARGKTIYGDLGCAACHGARGKGDGAAAKDLKDSDGKPIAVRDFTTGIFRGGDAPKDLYYRFVGGMNGTPMPAFGDNLEPADAWALVHYVLSLRTKETAAPLPSDPLAAGRVVANRYSCRGCHVLDDGEGGDVGPDLRVSGQKLDSNWVRAFLTKPRDMGKIYPWRPWRMPDLRLTEEEVETMVRYLAKMGNREVGPARQPELASLDKHDLGLGKNIFLLRCTECHTLGTVIETPLVKQQGPDLIQASRRVDFDWAHDWILNPRKIDARTRMTVPDITPEQTAAVRAFVWKTSMTELAKSENGGEPPGPGN